MILGFICLLEKTSRYLTERSSGRPLFSFCALTVGSQSHAEQWTGRDGLILWITMLSWLG